MLGRLILFGIVGYFGYRFLKNTFSSSDATLPRGAKDMLKGSDMVKDPQCGTYIVKERGIVKRIGDENILFCSEECAQKYISAAN